MLSSYPKVFHMGHHALQPLREVKVYLEEKVDGSQISFGVVQDGELKIRSREAEIDPQAPPKLFAHAVYTILDLHANQQLQKGWVYRCEAICTPKHNSLKYDRIPLGGLILFDIEADCGDFLERLGLEFHAKEIGLEVVPLLGVFSSSTDINIDTMLDRESVLGSTKIEGFVFKPVIPYFGVDGKRLVGKFVSEGFKEVHRKAWKHSNPTSKDILLRLQETYCHENRWKKAVMRLSEQEELLGDPKDIGLLVKAIQQDVLEECEDEIRETLFKWAWSSISRGVVRGFPEWYKRMLAEGNEAFATWLEEEADADAQEDVC